MKNGTCVVRIRYSMAGQISAAGVSLRPRLGAGGAWVAVTGVVEAVVGGEEEVAGKGEEVLEREGERVFERVEKMVCGMMRREVKEEETLHGVAMNPWDVKKRKRKRGCRN